MAGSPSGRQGGSGTCRSLFIQRDDKARAAAVVGAKSQNPQPYSSQGKPERKGLATAFPQQSALVLPLGLLTGETPNWLQEPSGGVNRQVGPTDMTGQTPILPTH